MLRSLFIRLIVAYFVIILATLIALSLLLTSFFMEYTFNTRTRQLLREARALNEHVEMYALGWISREYLYNHFKVIDRFLNTSIWITDELGYIWLPYSPAKEQEERWMEQKLTEEEFVQVLKGGTIIKTGRFGGRFPNPVLTVGVPLDIAGDIMGGIFLHSPVEGIRRTLSEVYGNVWRASLMSAFLAIVLVYWISRVISKPLIQINDISREFALGNFKQRVNVTSKDEIGQLAENFNAMADSLDKFEQMRRNFVANVSHELRSPLTSIVGYVQGVIDKTIQPEDQSKYLTVALDESKRLSKLISDLLDLAHIESGQFPLSISVFDINEKLRRILVSKEENINKSTQQVEICFEEDQCFVEADPDRIDQVIQNLVDNAVKFNRQGGRLFFKTWRHHGKVYLKIEDEGLGIPKDEIPMIWERFYQIEKARNSKNSGTGLGLSIVKKIVEQHDQNIWVNSIVGDKTAFVFSLKAAKKP